jgi:predicted O-methyltransferase YrrM
MSNKITEQIWWRQVPGWFNFEDVYDHALKKAPESGARFVEVGVLFGKSALYMAEAIRASGKQVSFDAVDVFNYDYDGLSKVVRTYREKRPGDDHSRLDEILEVARERGHQAVVDHVVQLSGLGDQVKVIKSSGQLWASQYEAESLDLVYVDALHTYEDTVGILLAFREKVRRGGILAGHDYAAEYNGVQRAVKDVLGDQVEVWRQSFVWTRP